MSIRRSFRYFDAQLIEIAQTIQKHFNNYEADFLEFDSTMTKSWLQDLTDAAWQVRIDDFERGYIRENTDQVVQQMEECGRAFRKARYFIRKAYARNSLKLEQFRLDSFRNVRYSQSKLIYYMNTFCKRVEDNRDALSAQGASEAFFAQLRATSDKMAEFNEEQEMSKSLRKAFTKERVGTLNDLYRGLRQVEEVAGYVFDEDSKEIDFFKLPMMTSGSTTTQEPDMLRPIVYSTEAAASAGEATTDASPGSEG